MVLKLIVNITYVYIGFLPSCRDFSCQGPLINPLGREQPSAMLDPPPAAITPCVSWGMLCSQPAEVIHKVVAATLERTVAHQPIYTLHGNMHQFFHSTCDVLIMLGSTFSMSCLFLLDSHNQKHSLYVQFVADENSICEHRLCLS